MSIVKICGLKDIEDFQKSAIWGADLLGMIFVEGARRAITINQAMLMKKSILTKQKRGCKRKNVVHHTRKKKGKSILMG